MKHITNIKPLVLAIVLSLFCSCYEANGQEQEVIGQAQSDTLQDKDGNVYTVRTMPDNKTWMTANLKISIPGSYCYENAEQKCKEYGRLYTWKAAEEGCLMLGEGWLLPTKEEWQQLAGQYGGVFGHSKDSGRTAYQALSSGGNSEFNAVLGGGRENNEDKYERLERHGFYWTATENDETTAYYYNFAKGSAKLFSQNEGEKSGAFSVRCVKRPPNLSDGANLK